MSGGKLGAVVGFAALLGVFVLAVGLMLRPRPIPRPIEIEPPSPYRNTRPGVSYVGDAACAKCHREIAAQYRSHPMGRSLGMVDEASPQRPQVPREGIAFEAAGFQYEVTRRGDRVFHRESRREGAGKTLSEVETEVLYALGSGTRGVSYLFERDGFLFQSPVSWYAQEKRWDLSPGYDRDNPHFGRAIDPDCLFCHSNHVEPIPGTEYRYEKPIFQGQAIGCERCHGPGELHARKPLASGESDWAIVNPADLEPTLRDSVCQQCHLLGTGRFPRAGRETFDYRPGLPLRRFVAVFQKAGAEDFQAVGHVEQMAASRCAQASDGRLSCISCHDPHRLPPEDEKVAYYRDRCLECHETQGCNAPLAVRRKEGDNCASCHMPRQSLSNIVHTAATDHRILRRPGATAAPKASTRSPGQIPLVDFFEPQMTQPERQRAGRDLGVALIQVGQAMGRTPGAAKAVGTLALPLLQKAATDLPGDFPAREAQGAALRFLGRPREALAVFRSVVAAAPRRESALRSLASTLTDLRELAEARDTWKRVVSVDPWKAADHLTLAQVCAELHDWPAAETSCRAALKRDPALLDARSLLVRVLLWDGRPSLARSEFETLVGFTPAGRDVWEAWYLTQQAQAGRKPGP